MESDSAEALACLSFSTGMVTPKTAKVKPFLQPFSIGDACGEHASRITFPASRFPRQITVPCGVIPFMGMMTTLSRR